MRNLIFAVAGLLFSSVLIAFVACFTLTHLIGDPAGLAVFDVACGGGFYTRMIRQ